MAIKIKGDLVMKEDMKFDESIEVEGNIICEGERRSLTVAGNINARDINAWDINARDINAWDINAGNINAWDINAGNINARDIIFCEKIDRTSLKGKIKAKMLIEKRSELEQKEWK